MRVKKYQAARLSATSGASPKPATSTPPRVAAAPVKQSKPGNKLSHKEQRELEELPKRIEALEREQGDIATQFADGAIYRNDTKRAKQLQTRNEEIGAEVMLAMARWEELEGKGGKLR